MVDLAQTIEEWKDIQSIKIDDQVIPNDHKIGQRSQKIFQTILSFNIFIVNLIDFTISVSW